MEVSGCQLDLRRAGLDGFKGQVFGGAAGFLLPLFEEAAVAYGQLLFFGDAELGGDLVDPVVGAFEFGEGA